MAGKGEGPAIGIDLGMTYSCVGVWQHDLVQFIAGDQGNRTTPSYVAFMDTGRLIGDAAQNQVAMNPTNTVFGKLSALSLNSYVYLYVSSDIFVIYIYSIRLFYMLKLLFMQDECVSVLTLDYFI
ncbi:hypothetical protein RND71_030856 [Anisodus tanguticus]|uniref:Heat shock protein 70 n=1 Tax=Anisodus tanguticus TaxID=243964 RepID=A0AAE1RIC6_9SOLA|nr:hypothetical protein RND71_030856 [Anisodus tanguticus]